MTLTPLINEKELLCRLQDGDEAAFEMLYRNYVDAIFRKTLYLTKSPEIAEEITQDVFLKIWERRFDIDPEKSFGAFIHRIAQNLITDLYRRLVHDRALREHLISSVSDLYDPMSADSDRQLVWQAMDSLPAQRKKVMALVKIEGRTYQEVSSLLGISPSTIRDHIVKGTKSLKSYLVDNKLTTLVTFASLISGVFLKN